MDIYGLLITRGDHEAFGDWCRDQLAFYKAVVCLDGSDEDDTRRQAEEFSDRLIYLHERQFNIPSKGDHGLRRIVHQELTDRFGINIWIMCCHTDEYCYHDPRRIAEKASREGFDFVSWFSPHFYPHPSELADLSERLRRPVQDRFSHYHWSYFGNDVPWIEDRMYKAASHVQWDETTHGSVRPHGLYRQAPFHPILRHFKVCTIDLAAFELGNTTTLYKQHWQDQPSQFRTGLPYPVHHVEDLFVMSVPKYVCCNRFDGSFETTWNMGEQYRPNGDMAHANNGEMKHVHLMPLIPQAANELKSVVVSQK